MGRTTNKKQMCLLAAKDMNLFLTKEAHIKISTVHKDYFSTFDADIVYRAQTWNDCYAYLLGYKAGQNALANAINAKI